MAVAISMRTSTIKDRVSRTELLPRWKLKHHVQCGDDGDVFSLRRMSGSLGNSEECKQHINDVLNAEALSG